MTYQEVLDNARRALAPRCRVCPDCDGRACRGEVPGAGGVGNGRAFQVCREYLADVKLLMDAVHEPFEADTSIELFGRRFAVPFFPAPIGGMKLNYAGAMTEADYAHAVVFGARDCGGFAFTGDGPDPALFPATIAAIREAEGVAVSTVKPWDNAKLLQRIRAIEDAGGMAFAVDVDSAALVNLKLHGQPVLPKPARELRELTQATALPLVVKGVLAPAAALRCAEAGAYGIVVSSHGGRIMQDAPAPCAMLPSIRAAVGDSLRIFVDGGVRSGADVFKCLALGADAVLIGRPYAIAAHGGGREGVRLYTERLAAQLRETMLMTDCPTLADITRERLLLP